MDLKRKGLLETPTNSSRPSDEPSRNLSSLQSLAPFDVANLCFGAGQTYPEFSTSLNPSSLLSFDSDNDVKMSYGPTASKAFPDWDPRAMLNNLTFLEQKIHDVQDIVRSIIGQEGQLSSGPSNVAAQQQLVTEDLTYIIIQLISTAGSLLPSIKNNFLSAKPSVGQQPGEIFGSDGNLDLEKKFQNGEVFSVDRNKQEISEQSKLLSSFHGEGLDSTIHFEDHDAKDYEDGTECENLPPGSYEVLQLEKEEILAPHTHFCTICGKGFKRDANLRMHMRGHGDEYKTPAALAKPIKDSNSEAVPIKRYSCPFIGCKRNKEHKKFQPLKTILCVKNHYKRTHCDKSYICNRCNSKKFSVIADLKTHEKHCGRDKWICSCGTTFSRKDKLFGHVALFQGHTPALPADDNKGPEGMDQVQNSELMGGAGVVGFSFGGINSDDVDFLDVKGIDDNQAYFSSINFDHCNFGGFHEFPRPAFEVSDNSFPFISGLASSYTQNSGDD